MDIILKYIHKLSFYFQYFCLLLTVLVAQISAAVWMYANNEKLEELVRYTVKTTVQSEYGSIEGRTETFDAIQNGVSINCLKICFKLDFQYQNVIPINLGI